MAQTDAIMEHKLFPATSVDIKAGSTVQGSIKGYAATWNNLDRQGDIILPGAFDKGLPAFMQDGFIALSHDPSRLPIAIPTDVRSDDTGLLLTADFHSTPEAQNARTVAQERMAAGKSVAFSIGYTVPPDGEERTRSGTRLLKQIDLMEVSLVTIPANPLAQVTAVKDASGADKSFNARIDALVSEAESVKAEAAHRTDLRTKEGRRISTATGTKLRALAAQLLALIEDASTDETADNQDAVQSAEAPAPKQQPPPQEHKKETKKPGNAGTAGTGTLDFYRRQLRDYESWAVRAGVPIYSRTSEEQSNGK
jgi:uncharacterized protein